MSDPDGILVVDKAGGWTSHDVVARCRRLFGTRRVGHAGTLDPMATGVLVLGLNRGTRLLTFLVGCDKAYEATIRLGQGTVTDDAEGEIDFTGREDTIAGLGEAQIRSCVERFRGEIEQVPSAVSAIKVDGQRAYARVRHGEHVELAARRVTVYGFEVGAVRAGESPRGPVVDVDVAVEVSSGTYVRALARDLGAALGVGGHLTALRRSRVGGFSLAHAVTLDDLDARDQAGRWSAVLDLGAAAARQWPVHELTPQEAIEVGHGRRIASTTPGQALVAAVGADGGLVAMLDESGPLARSHAVFRPGS